VQLTASALIGVAASDGKFLWRYDRPANRMAINCSTPVFQDGLVFAASAYGSGGGAVKLTKDASGAVKAEEVYFTTRMQNHHGGMIVYDGCLYGASGGNEGGSLACLDFQTGEVLWRDREAPKGSLALADGRLYLRTEEGALLLIEPNRERLVQRGRFDQPDRTASPAWTHPVIANGKLYVRDQDLLLCYDIKADRVGHVGQPALAVRTLVYGFGAKLGAPGFRYGFNASNRYSISAMSSAVSFNSEKLGDAGMVLPGPR
jgi:outer membrane protein assembly factor BamB